jgi:hypothetical protein
MIVRVSVIYLYPHWPSTVIKLAFRLSLGTVLLARRPRTEEICCLENLGTAAANESCPTRRETA